MRRIPKTNRYNQVRASIGVRMERNQKEILGVMMKQVGLDRSGAVCFACLLPEEEGKRRGEVASF